MRIAFIKMRIAFTKMRNDKGKIYLFRKQCLRYYTHTKLPVYRAIFCSIPLLLFAVYRFLLRKAMRLNAVCLRFKRTEKRESKSANHNPDLRTHATGSRSRGAARQEQEQMTMRGSDQVYVPIHPLFTHLTY